MTQRSQACVLKARTALQIQKAQKWKALDDSAKAQIRSLLLNTLTSQVRAITPRRTRRVA